MKKCAEVNAKSAPTPGRARGAVLYAGGVLGLGVLVIRRLGRGGVAHVTAGAYAVPALGPSRGAGAVRPGGRSGWRVRRSRTGDPNAFRKLGHDRAPDRAVEKAPIRRAVQRARACTSIRHQKASWWSASRNAQRSVQTPPGRLPMQVVGRELRRMGRPVEKVVVGPLAGPREPKPRPKHYQNGVCGPRSGGRRERKGVFQQAGVKDEVCVIGLWRVRGEPSPLSSPVGR